MYAIWLDVIFLYLRFLTVWLTMFFAFFFTSFSCILLFSQIPNDLTILFLSSSFTILFLKITSLSSGLVFIFSTTSFDLDSFISISFAWKNSSANDIISVNCSLLCAIQVVSLAYVIAVCR